MKPLLAVISALIFTFAVVAAVFTASQGESVRATHGSSHARAQRYLRPRPASVDAGFLPWNYDDPRPAFNVANCSVLDGIYDLHPSKDAVLPLDRPAFIEAADATWLTDQSPVLGLKIGEASHCYPLAILNWHSLVHDTLAGQAVHVFFDPPSGLALARRARAKIRPLGLSGYGYQGVGLTYERSNARLYDFLSGTYLNAKPASPDVYGAGDTDWLPLERMTWGEWRRLHGSTLVLSRETGFPANYDLDPYTAAALGPGGAAEDYWSSDTILAPDTLRDPAKSLRDKEWVLGVVLAGKPHAIPLSALQADDETQFTAAAGKLTIHSDPGADRYYAVDAQGNQPPQARLFWFAWRAHYPQTIILK
ncbi:MAG: DUF3179 domain-containing (seleno)protein [Armatimonadia bacterium]